MSCLNAQEISQLRNALHKLIDHAKETTKWP
jgi:hypothetical protein